MGTFKIDTGDGIFKITQNSGDLKAAYETGDFSRISAYRGEDRGLHTGTFSETLSRHGETFIKKN